MTSQINMHAQSKRTAVPVEDLIDIATYSEKVSLYLTDYIKFGDAKAAAILTFVGALGGGLGYLASQDVTHFTRHGVGGIAAALVPCAGVLIGIASSSWYCLRALAPRTVPTEQSLNSFPDIAKHAPHEYVRKVAALTPADVAAQYGVHNVTLARVADAKFTAISRAVIGLRIAILSACAFAIASVVVAIIK